MYSFYYDEHCLNSNLESFPKAGSKLWFKVRFFVVSSRCHCFRAETSYVTGREYLGVEYIFTDLKTV